MSWEYKEIDRRLQETAFSTTLHVQRRAYVPSDELLKNYNFAHINCIIWYGMVEDRIPSSAVEHTANEHRDHLTNRVGCWACWNERQ